MIETPLNIFIGYDPRENEAFEVCRSSLVRHSSVPTNVFPLMRDDLRKSGIYDRPADPLAATEFTYTRFLMPRLMSYRGWAMFVDCDFVFVADVAELFALADDDFAVMCVKHDHRPRNATKMDGITQTNYPRKNWSSMVLWNCGHPANRCVDAQMVNKAAPAFLHRFQWLDDALIGSVPETWNWLAGHSPTTIGYNSFHDDAPPDLKAVHYTDGGPWFKEWQDVPHAELWTRERDVMEPPNVPITTVFVDHPATPGVSGTPVLDIQHGRFDCDD